jgi:ribosome biogenesis GTPase / thiamine phosphate phosphatase
MHPEDLGYANEHENYCRENGLTMFGIGRILAEHKERYILSTGEKEYEAEITGNLRFKAVDRSGFPAAGDWVAFQSFDDSLAIIHHIFPRRTVLERKAVGKSGEKQIIATNVDTAFLVQAADRDFNIPRLERYLTVCYSAGVEPVIILSKTDLLEDADIQNIKNVINLRIKDVPLVALSNITHNGYTSLLSFIQKGKTYCFLGSSGVGKSTLINQLIGKEQMETKEISKSTNKGRHTTSHRELIVLEQGGILIDNPGMREIGIADAGEGLDITFESIRHLAENCRFSDCTHTHEKGCAVMAAVEDGSLERKMYDNYMKLEREQQHFTATIAEKRKKDKAFGKMVKEAMKEKKKRKSY